MTDAAGVERAVSVAGTGVVAVATRLAGSRVVDDRVCDADGTPLTPTTLERVADDAVRRAGGDPAEGATVEVPDGDLRPSDLVIVGVEPQVDGVAGALSRTFVVDGSGGWERRAAVAVGMAHDAVRRVVEPGVSARRVVDEAVAELGAYGLATAEGPVARGLNAGATPSFSTDDPLDAGHVFVLAPTARDPDVDRGRVRVGECYAVTDAGCRALGSTPTALSPAAY